MGPLDKIRELHPGVNILRTLSTWNELQKQRRQYYNCDEDEGSRRRRGGGGGNDEEVEEMEVKGGQLVISPEQTKSGGRTKTTDMVMMTLMGTYQCRAWEHDSHFQRELERFVEDALQFQLCLNNSNNGGGCGNMKEAGATK
jgi:hypothetical protein